MHLGLRQVLLLDSLHSGPQRLLADHVRLHAVADLADVELFAQVLGRRSERRRRGCPDGQRDHEDDLLRAPASLAASADSAVSSMWSMPGRGVVDAVDRGVQRGLVAALALEHDAERLRARSRGSA